MCSPKLLSKASFLRGESVVIHLYNKRTTEKKKKKKSAILRVMRTQNLYFGSKDRKDLEY